MSDCALGERPHAVRAVFEVLKQESPAQVRNLGHIEFFGCCRQESNDKAELRFGNVPCASPKSLNVEVGVFACNW